MMSMHGKIFLKSRVGCRVLGCVLQECVGVWSVVLVYMKHLVVKGGLFQVPI